MSEKEATFWNGQPCEARRVRVIVGPCLKSTFWHNGLEGTEREAVEVVYAGQQPFYMDNEDGSGWRKVTVGRGGPGWYHASLPVDRVLSEVAS